MLEEGDPVWTLMVSYFMQKDTDDDGTTNNDRRGRQCTQPGPIDPTISHPIQEGVSVQAVDKGDVTSAQQHGPFRCCRDPG